MSDKKTDQINVKGLDPELVKKAKIKAINEDRPLSRVIEEMLEKYVVKPQKEKRQETK